MQSFAGIIFFFSLCCLLPAPHALSTAEKQAAIIKYASSTHTHTTTTLTTTALSNQWPLHTHKHKKKARHNQICPNHTHTNTPPPIHTSPLAHLPSLYSSLAPVAFSWNVPQGSRSSVRSSTHSITNQKPTTTFLLSHLERVLSLGFCLRQKAFDDLYKTCTCPPL